MDIKGEQFIPVPRPQVWAALNDVEVLKQAIPGCDSMTRLSDTEIEATVTAKVGPVKATFKGQVTLSDLDPPNGYTISGQGNGGVAGNAKGGAKVRLSDDGTGTLISYATRDGSTAADGNGRNSPYTSSLLAHLDANEDIALVLRRVRQQVLSSTAGRQEPWEYGSLVGGALVLSRLASTR